MQQALAQRSEWDLCVHTVVRALTIGCSDMAQAHFLHGIALVWPRCLSTTSHVIVYRV